MKIKKDWPFENVFQSKAHRDLVLVFKERIEARGEEVILYGMYKGKRPNVLILKKEDGKKHLVGVAECLHTTTIKAAVEKLLMYPEIPEKYVVRWRKPSNPKARKIIRDLVAKGIVFLEMEPCKAD